MGFLTSILGGVYGYILAALLSGAGVWYVTHRVDEANIEALRLADANASIEAITDAKNIQHSQDQTALTAAVREATAQDALNQKTITIIKKVPVYVTPAQEARACITIGLYRLLADAAAKSDSGSAAATPGQSDDACADISESALASWFTAYADAASKNAEQLNGLEQAIRDISESQKQDAGQGN